LDLQQQQITLLEAKAQSEKDRDDTKVIQLKKYGEALRNSATSTSVAAAQPGRRCFKFGSDRHLYKDFDKKGNAQPWQLSNRNGNQKPTSRVNRCARWSPQGRLKQRLRRLKRQVAPPSIVRIIHQWSLLIRTSVVI